MTWVSWLIVVVPLAVVIWTAIRSRRYVRDISDYLASGRVAGRYVIAVGDMSSWLSVITLVALCEQNYQTGMAIGFWAAISIPLATIMSLTGYCIYRFRQTRCLSIGQFLEQRYSQSFRIVAASIRTLAEMFTNAIGPAVAVHFFIYFLGLPHRISIFGLSVSTYALLVAFLLILALLIVLPAGRISLLITDCLQGILSYPVFVVFTFFVLANISWFQDVTPVMFDRVAGESFLNPMDISQLRDFNIFALIVTMGGSVLNRAAWLGNGTSSSGRNAHEQKMANILGTWRNGFSYTTMVLIGIFVVTFMLGSRFAPQAHEVRVNLSSQVLDEVMDDPGSKAEIMKQISALPVEKHVIGQDPPYSRIQNPDTRFFDTAYQVIRKQNLTDGNTIFQEFRSLYNQMMLPMVLKSVFSPLLMGLFTLLMLMLMLSTDDTRIFNASSTIIQDIILPFRSEPMKTETHLFYLKICSTGVAVFFFVVSLFFSQLDYINMFIVIMSGIWLGAAGPIMLGGLYTRFGTTFGAWCALIFGSGTSAVGLICQRNWADRIYPWLNDCGYVSALDEMLILLSSPFNPYIKWRMDPIKFPINSMELYFIAMLLGIAAYIVGSLVSYRKPFNLDRLLHRGKYRDAGEAIPGRTAWTWRSIWNKLIGITPEYTFGDKLIAWSVFFWSFIYQFGLLFVGVLIWNAFTPWSDERWGIYFFITTIAAMLIVGIVSTVWFFIGGVIDLRRLFRALELRRANPLDNGQVQGHVALVDAERFEAIEGAGGSGKRTGECPGK